MLADDSSDCEDNVSIGAGVGVDANALQDLCGQGVEFVQQPGLIRRGRSKRSAVTVANAEFPVKIIEEAIERLWWPCRR